MSSTFASSAVPRHISSLATTNRTDAGDSGSA